MTDSEEINLTPEERTQLLNYLGYSAPIPEEKHSVHSFLHKVATADDTTKVGNLTAEEVGLPQITLRADKELALISDRIMNNDLFAKYYSAKGEILTSTSLSKEAKLLSLAVVQKRIIEDQTGKERKVNKGWFKPKGDLNQQPPTEAV